MRKPFEIDGLDAAPITPRNSPFGPVTLRAITVVQSPVIRLKTGSTTMAGECGSDLKVLK